MAERKVLNKYYPPDYDPSKIPRIKKKNKQNDVRIMAPFNLKCSTCGNYIANATKFNAKKETVEDETYNNLLIFRFYIKCPRCMGTIIFRTNPKEQGYEVEHGATENFMALKMAEKQAREEAEAEEEEEKINPMMHLENRTKASKLQMELSEQIQSLRARQHRHRNVDLDSIIRSKRHEEEGGGGGGGEEERSTSDDDRLKIKDKEEEDQIRAEAIKMMKKKELESTSGNNIVRTSSETTNLLTGIKRPPSSSKSSTKSQSALASLKKKIKIIPKVKGEEEVIGKD